MPGLLIKMNSIPVAHAPVFLNDGCFLCSLHATGLRKNVNLRFQGPGASLRQVTSITRSRSCNRRLTVFALSSTRNGTGSNGSANKGKDMFD